MKNNFLNKLVFLFAVASISGYIWEVSLTYIRTGELCNRGFLRGPWLPIYGFGALFLLLLLYRFACRPAIVFFLSGLIGSFVELVAGLGLSTYWNRRYWDYSGLQFDLAGYVSLVSFLGFCVAGALWVCVVVPLLYKVWAHISAHMRYALVILFLIMFLIDYGYSFIYPNSGVGVTF